MTEGIPKWLASKALLDWGGAPLVVHVAESLRPAVRDWLRSSSQEG